METLTSHSVIPNIRHFDSNHEHIKQLLKSFWSEATTMAIKQNQSPHEKEKDTFDFVYSELNNPPSQPNYRTSMTEAKRAFLNSTVNNSPSFKSNKSTEYPVLHYAQLAMVRDNEDSRSTGGGKKSSPNCEKKNQIQNITSVKSIEQKKVSFKVRPASTSYRKPPISTKTVTITNTKVSELTKKFNSLIEESAMSSTRAQSKNIITPSKGSSPSSTLSSSPNIKIVLRQKRRKRGKKKRCSSMDDMENNSTSSKTNVSRSKSDGVKFRKSKRALKYESSEPNSGTDSNDSNSKSKNTNKRAENKIKNVITKFEFEIIAQKNPNFNSVKGLPSDKKITVSQIKEKPKVPEKKSTLTLTKNVVVKDGVPKIKSLKPTLLGPVQLENSKNGIPRKNQVYDKLKFKTNYIHSDKLPLKAVEIIHEDINEGSVGGALDSKTSTKDINTNKKDDLLQSCLDVDLDSKNSASKSSHDYRNEQDTQTGETNIIISPNNSFLWRRSETFSEKTNDDQKKAVSNCSPIYESIPLNEKKYQKDSENVYQFNKTVINIENADFESDLVEAVNKVLVEDDHYDYEPLAPRDISNVVVIPVRSIERKSKINCPLPEIPSQDKLSTNQNTEKNHYQCLIEMRSHPEGDDNSLHNYEECESRYEERTRGDGDSDDGYEYCKTQVKPYCLMSSSGIQIAESFNTAMTNSTRSRVTKSVSNASSVSYEQIGSAREYDHIQIAQHHEPPQRLHQIWSKSSTDSSSTVYNDCENIYDTVKLSDSTSHCYESVPSSPSVAKMRLNLRKQLTSAVKKRFSLDSQSTVTSDQKTNSIYGQRSMQSYNGQETGFTVPSSESGSDRSDDWVDLSDDERHAQYGEQKIIIVQERSRGKKSPLSWSQKVRHQWQKQPSHVDEENDVSVTSPTKVHILTCEKSPFFSRNDELVRRIRSLCSEENEEEVVRVINVEQQESWIKVVTSFLDGEHEIQENVTFIENDASDFGHLYESLGPPAPAQVPAPPIPPAPFDEDIDSFDSDSDFDDSSHQKSVSEYISPSQYNQPPERLPSPPSSGQYTLIKIANAAQRKMKQLKRNLTKKYANGIDNPPKPLSTTSANIYDSFKNLYKSSYKTPAQTTNRQEDKHTYSNVDFKDIGEVKKTDNPTKLNGFKEELMTVLGEKRLSTDTSIPPPRPSLPSPALIERIQPEKPSSPSQSTRKDPGTLRKIKSRFRRAASIATDMDTEIPSVLKITNSTFYLTDSMDSGFSNCSDSGPGEVREASAPVAPSRQREGKLRHAWSESSPCLALTRPAVPPPPPPLHLTPVTVSVTPVTPPPASPDPQISAVNEELKRLLPTLRKDKEKDRRRSRTSWYAEAGELHIGNSSWYSEIGSLPVGNISSSSGASSGSHPASPLPRSLFPHEPLYQFYNAAKVESQCREGDSDSEVYEGAAPARRSAMALVAPRGPARTLWCEVPEVRASTVLSSLAPNQKRLQEAKFELLTSEASYLNSLNVLESHFIAHPAFRESSILTREDREILFGTILPVKKCSQLLMNELEKCWQENILLTGICDIVWRHAEQHFHVYVKYCEHQALMVRTLQRLRENQLFSNTLRRLESHPACQSLSLHSFLMLPMQRITRLPLLVDAVLRNLAPPDDEYDECMHALALLNHYVCACNEGARSTERVEEMLRLSRQIEFPPHLHNAPVIGPAISRRDRKPVRWLVRSGEMTQLVWKADEIKLTFGKKFSKIPLHLFLFNDVLIITKKKGEDSYIAKDWCWRALLAVSSSDVTAAAKHALLLTLLEDSKGRTQEMLMSCESETCVSRWVEALSPVAASDHAGEAVYAGWDCPQVHALYSYSAAQPDELSLEQGDVVNVTRKTSEGWYYGERTRDGALGWFPGAYCAEIMSAHVRARNLRQRYRLLALSSSYRGHRRKT